MNTKIKSRKFIIAIWAALSFTLLGIFALIKDATASWLTSSLPVLAGIVAAWVGVQGKADIKKK